MTRNTDSKARLEKSKLRAAIEPESKRENTPTDAPRWDLSIMYTELNDPQLDLDIAKLVELSRAFNSYKGKLATALPKAIGDYSTISMLSNKVLGYLHLRKSTDLSNGAINAKIADTERIISEVDSECMTFFEIELVALTDEVLADYYATDPVVAKHRPWIEHIRIFKSHILTEEVESALTKRSSFGASSWSEFYDELEADLEFEHRGKTLTLTEMLHILTSSQDSDERFEIMTTVNNGLKAFSKYSAQTLYMVYGSRAVERRDRKYAHPMESRNKSNRTPDAVVDALHNAVLETAGPLAQRYYRLKAAHLGKSTLRWSDRNAPMPFADTAVVPFKDGLEMVTEAYRSFSPTLAQLVEQSAQNSRIDVPTAKGKRGGAFNMSLVLPGNVPASFTLLNYLNTTDDVMTLAHELGHGLHGLLAGAQQGPLMAGAPIAYAETASIFGERTTFNFLKQRLLEQGNKESLLAMTMAKIDDVINTVVRQINFSNFERRIHGMDTTLTTWNQPQKLSADELNKIWIETLLPFYGQEGDIFTYANMDRLWAYVSHFHNTFYVYGYAFGQLLTDSIYAQKEKFGDQFEPLYLAMLKSGSTKNVVDLLAPFNLDPTSESFWTDGITKGLGELIAEAEELSAQMGVIVPPVHSQTQSVRE